VETPIPPGLNRICSHKLFNFIAENFCQIRAIFECIIMNLFDGAWDNDASEQCAFTKRLISYLFPPLAKNHRPKLQALGESHLLYRLYSGGSDYFMENAHPEYTAFPITSSPSRRMTEVNFEEEWNAA
jgi:hypothetical protein